MRERRLGDVRRTVEGFALGLGRLTAGHEPEFDGCVSRSLETRIRNALQPFLVSEETIRPDFGAYGKLRIEGDLLRSDVPVRAWLEFDDRSMLQTRTGRLLPVPRRRVNLLLRIALQPCEIVDCVVLPPEP